MFVTKKKISDLNIDVILNTIVKVWISPRRNSVKAYSF